MIKRKLVVNALGIFLGLTASLTARAAPIEIYLATPSGALPPSTSLIVLLRVNGLAPPALGAFDLNIAFDPSILAFNSVTFGDSILGDQLDPTGKANTVSLSSPGLATVELFDLSLDTTNQLNNLQAASFTLSSLIFDAVGFGISALTISINALSDADGNPVPADLQNGRVDVEALTNTPEPSSEELVICCLVVLCAVSAYSSATRRSLLDALWRGRRDKLS